MKDAHEVLRLKEIELAKVKTEVDGRSPGHNSLSSVGGRRFQQ
jgi:hypothetical protein